MEQSYDVALTSQEWRIIIGSLNRLRNRLISEGRYTDTVDELLIKVVNTKVKKRRLWGPMSLS
jgi:endo-alpha-1,4-polygalactosaminidase (GH114 family)